MKQAILFLVVVLIFVSSMNGQVNLKSGLVAHYPFVGNANDQSGNAYHGTVNGATLTSDRFGRANNAYSFNGIDNNIIIANTLGINLFSGFTIAAWVNFTVDNTSGQTIVSNHKNYEPNGFNLAASFNKAQINTNNANYSCATAETYNDGKWHLFIGTFNGSQLVINVDGQTKATLNAEFTIGGLANIHIGSDTDLSYYNGKIDDIRIYNRVLNNSEVQALFNETSTTELTNVSVTPLSVYPNPASTHFQIKGIEDKATLSVYGIDGKLIFNREYTNNEFISITDLTKGIYLLKISTKELVTEKKLIIN